ncbi:unnamed protein product [Boreogadus saida]
MARAEATQQQLQGLAPYRHGDPQTGAQSVGRDKLQLAAAPSASVSLRRPAAPVSGRRLPLACLYTSFLTNSGWPQFDFKRVELDRNEARPLERKTSLDTVKTLMLELGVEAMQVRCGSGPVLVMVQHANTAFAAQLA